VFTKCYYGEGEFGDEAFNVKTSMAQIISVTKLKQRNLGVKENCALKKLYVRVWIEFIWLRV